MQNGKLEFCMSENSAEKIITYEQPLNEHIRICLRLEYLFKQIAHHIDLDSSWDSRVALQAILDVLAFIDRPDLKNKLGQILNQYLVALVQLEQLPNANTAKIQRAIESLNQAIDLLHSLQGKIGQELRDNEFLAAIVQRMTMPAGTCSSNLPVYHLWLQQPFAVRNQHLKTWLNSFADLKQVILTLLKLTRESTSPQPRSASGGFYQENLDPAIPYQMIRLEIPVSLKLFPEISVGRYLLTMHFFELNHLGKAVQTKQDVEFKMACCKLYIPPKA